MKRLSVFLIILACLLTLGLAFVSCDDGDTGGEGGGDSGGGTLTLIDIPSELDGKFASFTGSSVYGFETLNVSGTNFGTLPKVSNGKVILKLWVWNEATNRLDKRYSGNDTIPWYYCDVYFYNNKEGSGSFFGRISFREDIIFSNGSTIRSVALA